MAESSWHEHEPTLRAAWMAEFGKSGMDWWEVREAHRFGWEAAMRPEFARKTFEQAEADLAAHWCRPLSATEELAWDYMREAVYSGWQKAREVLAERSVEG